MSDLLRPCEEHGRYERHPVPVPDDEVDADQPDMVWCDGGHEPTTDELLAVLVEEGVLEREKYGDGVFRWLLTNEQVDENGRWVP